jgi:hypothetical protein
LNGSSLTWTASTGIPFTIKNSTSNGNTIISFECIAPHGLTKGEYVELSFKYDNKNLFQVYSLGNGLVDSEEYIFNIYNNGYTGTTFANNRTGTFKRVINPDNFSATTSQYYIRQHKVLTNVEDLVMTKSGFEKNVFLEERKFEFSSITPNNTSRVSQKTSSNCFNVTTNKDLDLGILLDNQKRPLSELFLTIINKGFTGYFNEPNNGIGLKQGWQFNISSTSNSWWSTNNVKSNTNIPVSGYSITQGSRTFNFFYNSDLKIGDIIDGDFCEWNNYEQIERVISPYYQKLKYNQDFTINHTTKCKSEFFQITLKLEMLQVWRESQPTPIFLKATKNLDGEIYMVMDLLITWKEELIILSSTRHNTRSRTLFSD